MPIAESLKKQAVEWQPTRTGRIPFKPSTSEREYETFYKTFGDLKAAKRRPLVVVHGGPGMTHDYLVNAGALYREAGTPVVLYDQLGGGLSTHLREADPSFWTVELFIEELINLLQSLEIQDDFDLFGQSWGGCLISQYAATVQPKGLKRLIISNSPASMELMTKGVEALLDQWPEEFRAKLKGLEAKGDFVGEYEALTTEFYKQHMCICDPWPHDLLLTFGSVQMDPTVYGVMAGPSILTFVGSLKTWTVIPILHKISVPTLLITSPNDVIQECAWVPFVQNIPNIKRHELQNSSHVGHLEEPENFYTALLDFLNA